MIIDVKYGKDGVQKADIPDENYVGTFYPKDVECGDPDKVRRSHRIRFPGCLP